MSTELRYDDLPDDLKKVLGGMRAHHWYYTLHFWEDELEPLVQAGWVEKDGWSGAGGLKYRITDLGLQQAVRMGLPG